MLHHGLLAQLQEVGLSIMQHDHKPNEWYVSRVINGLPHGEVGPFPSAEAALIAAVRWILVCTDAYREERDKAEEEVQSLMLQLGNLLQDEDQPPKPFRKLLG